MELLHAGHAAGRALARVDAHAVAVNPGLVVGLARFVQLVADRPDQKQNNDAKDKNKQRAHIIKI